MAYHQRPDTSPYSDQALENERVRRRRLAVGSALTYIVLIFVGAAILAPGLHDWARQRILASATMMTVALDTAKSGESPDSVAVQDLSVPDSSAVDSNVAMGTAGAQPAASEPINVLLMGTDARPDEDAPPLTDTLILVSLDPQTGTAGMLSLPRDLWVPIPGLDTTTKINTAYRLGQSENYPGGGPQLVKDTVSSFIGQPVPYYVRVSFSGFVEIMDLIDGVDIVAPVTIHDEEYPTSDYGVELFHLDAGEQHLDGETALKYVRTRHVDSDYGRARRQQQLIRAVIDKVMRADMLPAILAKAPRLLYTMRSSIDTDMPMATQLELANYFSGNSINELRQLVLDGRYGEETYSDEGAWILLPDRAKVRSELDTFFSPTPPGAVVMDTTNLGWVRVEVLNGTDEPGIAARTRDLLQSHGWHVVAIGDADRSDYAHTLIVNYGVPDTFVERVGDDLHCSPIFRASKDWTRRYRSICVSSLGKISSTITSRSIGLSNRRA